MKLATIQQLLVNLFNTAKTKFLASQERAKELGKSGNQAIVLGALGFAVCGYVGWLTVSKLSAVILEWMWTTMLVCVYGFGAIAATAAAVFLWTVCVSGLRARQAAKKEQAPAAATSSATV